LKLWVSFAAIWCLLASNAAAGPLAESVAREDARLAALELTQRMSRGAILQIAPAGRPHRRRNALIGLAIGGAAGVVATMLHCRGKDASCHEVAPAYFLPLAGSGALIGVLWP
jgi:hypothetical protein